MTSIQAQFIDELCWYLREDGLPLTFSTLMAHKYTLAECLVSPMIPLADLATVCYIISRVQLPK